MVKALFDTNILIDYLNGIEQARDEIGRYSDVAISVITWMEVMVGATSDVADKTRGFLQSFDIIAIDEVVAERAVVLRQKHRMRLPDAIIWASADVKDMLLVTRNTRDFPSEAPGVHVPYKL